MSAQRDVLPKAIALLRTRDPDCAVVVIGSVQHGYERPGSDVDTLAIVANGTEPDLAGWTQKWEILGARSIERDLDGVTVQVFFATESALERWLREVPFHLYPFSQGVIFCDPRGRASKYQQTARAYFDAHPAIAREWEAQLQAHRLAKVQGVDASGCYLAADGRRVKHLSLDDFARRIAGLAAGAEQKGL